MAHPVFLSYARSASRTHARAAYEALGGEAEGLAFLDEEDIDYGERFPERIIDALLGARVVVIFAEPVYFTRWYCLLEFRLARTPFLKSLDPGSPLARGAALAPLVLALPPNGTPPQVDRFPPLAQATNWPSVADPAAIAALVRGRLAEPSPTLGELLAQVGAGDLRTELVEAVALPPPLPPSRVRRVPLQIAPSIREAFVGRGDDLWRIDDLLATRDGGASATAALAGAIGGGGGLGKTRLALEYLHRFGPRRFPGGLFWIDADADPASLEARQHEILQALDPKAPPLAAYRDPAQPRRITDDLTNAVLALPADAPPLFVVDNVPEPARGEFPKPLSSWCPVVGIAPVLATSRTRIAMARGAVTPIDVDVLSVDAAIALLTRDVPDRATLSRDEWTEIAEWVGRLPLALDLLNALLQGGAVSSRELPPMARAGEITSALDEGMEALRPSVEPGALRGVTEALSVSYDKLSETEQEAARLLAWLAPDPIPTELLEALGTELFTAATRGVLVHRSFVTRTPSEGIPIYGTMHRVLADFLRTRSSDPIAELARVTTALVSVMAPDRCRDPEHWPLLTICVSHARVVLDRGTSMAADVGSWPSLGLSMGILRDAQGLSREAGSVFQHVLLVCRRVFGEEQSDTLAATNNLAHTLGSQGDFSGARKLQEKVLEVSSRVLGEEHPDTLTAMSNLASIFWSQGDFSGARGLEKKVLKVRRRVLGEEHPDTLTAMNNLAGTLQERGDLAGSRALQEKVLKMRRRVVGEEHPDTLTAINNLATTLWAQEDFSGARELHENVFRVSRRVLGEEHPDTIMTMGNLAAALQAQGDLSGARELQKEVLQVVRRVLGEDHPDTLMAMNNLAVVLRKQGDFSGARELHDSVIEVSKRLLGETHPNTITSMSNLALVLRAKGEPVGAEVLEAQVRAIQRRTE